MPNVINQVDQSIARNFDVFTSCDVIVIVVIVVNVVFVVIINVVVVVVITVNVMIFVIVVAYAFDEQYSFFSPHIVCYFVLFLWRTEEVDSIGAVHP